MLVGKKDKVVPVLDGSWEGQSCSSPSWKLGRTWWFQSFMVSDNILSASSVWHWTGVSCPECPYLWEELHQSATLSPPFLATSGELFAWSSRLMVCWGSVVQLSDTPLSVSLVSFNVTLQPDIYSPYLMLYICYPLCETKKQQTNKKQTKENTSKRKTVWWKICCCLFTLALLFGTICFKHCHLYSASSLKTALKTCLFNN